MTGPRSDMLSTLAHLRLTVWRRTPNAMRGFGATLGLLAAGWTLLVALGLWGDPALSGELLTVAFVLWLVGWLMGPLQSGRGDVLSPEWFATLPLDARRLAPRLVLVSCVGIGGAITVVAALALAALGARDGLAPALVGLAAAVPLTIGMVTAARLVGEGLRAATRSRLTIELVAAQWGLFIAAMTVGWFVVWDLAGRVGDLGELSLPGGLADVLRVMPTGWGVVAVEAAGQGRWLLSLTALVALVASAAGAIWLWSTLLHRRMTGGRVSSISRPRRVARGVLPRTPLGAVVAKDLRTWWRDPRRGIEVRSALWAGVFATAALWVVLPDIVGFAGVFIVLIGAMACVNVYAMDGTGLWLSLVTPGALRVDVRGRQLAWLLVFTPAAVLGSGLGLVATQAWWALPWVLSLLLALLGGASGLIPLLSIVALAPEIDPHKRGGNPTETGADATGLYFLMLGASLVAAAPVAGCLALAAVNQDQSFAWFAVAVGAVTGGGLAWGLGRAARRRLEARGPELLQLMRTGYAAAPVSVRRQSMPAPANHEVTPSASARETPVRRTAPGWMLGVLWTVAMVALVPQGLLPLAFLAAGIDAQAWFVALYLPSPWSYAAAVAFVVVGGLVTMWAVRLQRAGRSPRSDGGSWAERPDLRSLEQRPPVHIATQRRKDSRSDA